MPASRSLAQPAVAAIVLALGSFRHAPAQVWVPLPPPGPGMTLQMDTASVSTVGTNTFGSFRWTGLVDGDTTNKGVGFAYLERAVVVNCRTGQVTIEARAYYAPADTIIEGIFWEENEWRFANVQDGTASSLERDLLCAAAKQRSETGLPSAHTTSRAFIVRPATIAPHTRTLDIVPAFAGFRLGQPLRIARPLLGLPIHVDTLGSGTDHTLSFQNPETGITLLASWTDGVGAILATKRETGALDGVRVGDRRTNAISRWGSPAAGGADTAVWIAGRWLISASFDRNGRITRLGVAQ